MYKQINGQHQTALRQAVKKNVLDALADGEAFDVPPSLLKQEYESVAKAMNADSKDNEDNERQKNDEDSPAADEGMDADAKAEAEADFLREKLKNTREQLDTVKNKKRFFFF